MKQYETVTREVRIETKRLCDACGNDVHDFSGDYNTNEVTINHEFGDVWNSEEIFTSRLDVDMCGDCFVKHILPAIE